MFDARGIGASTGASVGAAFGGSFGAGIGATVGGMVGEALDEACAGVDERATDPERGVVIPVSEE